MQFAERDDNAAVIESMINADSLSPCADVQSFAGFFKKKVNIVINAVTVQKFYCCSFLDGKDLRYKNKALLIHFSACARQRICLTARCLREKRPLPYRFLGLWF